MPAASRFALQGFLASSICTFVFFEEGQSQPRCREVCRSNNIIPSWISDVCKFEIVANNSGFASQHAQYLGDQDGLHDHDRDGDVDDYGGYDDDDDGGDDDDGRDDNYDDDLRP